MIIRYLDPYGMILGFRAQALTEDFGLRVTETENGHKSGF